MATDEVAQDVSQVNDFHFHTCRKFRICPRTALTTSDDVIVRNRLATSSQLGVTFAMIDGKKMVCFPTKSVIDFKLTRENMNVEVADFPMKPLEFAGIVSINDMGVNSDGSLLAILHTNNNNVSVDVFDIKSLCSTSNSAPMKAMCKTTVGNDPVNQGTVLEWNPAFPDTFAAASSDRTLMVVKVDVKNPSSQKLVGAGKLGAYTTSISWSPKGKQLTIGDSLGKVVQLKPELDVVRSQFGPDGHGKVTGICWLATTEWLVSFEKDGVEQDAFLMRCKKDKPTEWMQYHELSYSSSKLRPQLLAATQLLVDWNVVIVGNSKTSEIATLGKRDEWQTWIPTDGEAIYLPTTAEGKDTVALGVTVDRTMTEQVSLKPDGSQKHRASPLVLCLTSDGVLTAHHVISSFAQHNPCQIVSQNIPITGLAAMKQAAPVAPPVAQVPVAKPSTVFEQKPKTEPVAPVPVQTPKPAAIGSASSAFKPVVSQTPPAAAAPVPKTPAPAEDNKKAELLATKKKALIERIAVMNSTVSAAKDAVMKMSLAAGTAKSTISECAEVVKASLADSKEVIDELKKLIGSIERMEERTKHSVKEMDFEIEEKMGLVAEMDSGERMLERLRDMSETEKMMRFNKLENAADMLNGKFADCNETMRKLRAALSEKEFLRKQAILSPLRHNANLNQLRSGAETEVALKVMRNVSKIIIDTRERIQRTELDFLRFQRDARAHKDTKSDGAAKLNTTVAAEVSILEQDVSVRHNLSDAEIVKARQALVARIQKRGVVKTKNVTVESYKQKTGQKPKEAPIDTSGLSSAILKLSMTPRRVMTTSALFSPATSVRRDATTQADEPPVVKTVVVTVESPARPPPAAPVVATPKTVTTTTASATKAPEVAVPKPKEEEKPTSSSIFSGNLFGSKTTSTSPMVAPKEEPKKVVEEVKEEPKEVPKVEEEPKVEPSKEPVKEPIKEVVKEEPKVEEKVPEPPVVEQKTPEQKKEESASKTPSFSFNTSSSSTPKQTSSIFGGGLKTQTTPAPATSSIFGAAAQSTPTAPATASSIFGGGAKTGTSPFGSFGQSATPAAAATQPTAAAAGGAAAPTVSFSFNTAAASSAPKPTFGSFGATTAPAKPSSMFGGAVAAPSVPNVDDGMEDDSMINAGGPGGFMSGLGGSSSTSAASNPFAPKPATGSAVNASSLFGGGASAGQQQKPAFSFSNPTQQPAAASTSTSSVFGSAPKFGSQPVFGAKPFGAAAPAGGGGGLTKNASIFGGAAAAAAPASGGFAQFATGQKSSSLFGAAAAAPTTGSSIFGGGAQTTAAPSSSIFGGGASANSNKPTSFTSWR